MPAMGTAAASLRNVSLDFTPLEIAGRCRHLPDVVFFDTSLESAADGEISIVAANPSLIIEGSSDADWAALQATLDARRMAKLCDDAIPHGFAAGYVEYDGAFRFGIYENALVHRHADQTWIEIGDMRSQLAGPLPMPRVAAPQFKPTLDRHFAVIVL